MGAGQIENIKGAAALHDLGKIGVSEKLLLKRARLTKNEFEEVKKHPQIGVDIIRPIHSLSGMIPAMLHHHEWWNGRGYPDGLKMQKIPISARVIAVADVYQALISDRPYRGAYGKEQALAMLEQGAGTQFDPDIVNIFIKLIRKNKS